MKTCINCGASLYRGADPFCAHDFGEAPEPALVNAEPTAVTVREARYAREMGWPVDPGELVPRGSLITRKEPTDG